MINKEFKKTKIVFEEFKKRNIFPLVKIKFLNGKTVMGYLYNVNNLQVFIINKNGELKTINFNSIKSLDLILNTKQQLIYKKEIEPLIKDI